MKLNNSIKVVAATIAAVTMASALPMAAFAQDWHHDNGWHSRAVERQDTKNEWRNLAIAAGGVAAYGFVQHDPTIGFVGAAGALYSLDRYNQDRISQDRAAQVRASFFNRPYFYRDGVRYDRRTVWNNGHQFYRFARH